MGSSALGSIRNIVPAHFRNTVYRARVAIRANPLWARYVTPLADGRALPHFLVIGGQRCGTTTFHALLSQHPRLMPPKDGEVHYFDLNYQYGIRWYRARFPKAEALRARQSLTFDTSPYYLYHPLVPERIASSLPEAKFIVLLRNPTVRAFSHYMHECRNGRETLSFEEALEAEDERLAGEEERLAINPEYNSFAHRRYSYRSRGHYAAQLERWLRHVDRDRMLFIKSEMLFKDPQGELARVWQFLDIEPATVLERRHRNQTRYQHVMDADTVARLDEHFRRANHALPEVAGDAFVW